MATTVTMKRGTTLAGTVDYTPGAGPANLLGTTVTSDVQDSGGTIYHLTTTMSVDGLSFVLRYDGSTADWNLGPGRWDIKFSTDGVVFYTETMRINIIDEVTL
jgi:hypothetical protein